jgi:hypothetical protein
MADNTGIELTDATWNPTGGCTRVDEGCRNCYAEIMAARFSGPGQWGEGLARTVKTEDGRTDHRWTGKLVLHEAALDRPLRRAQIADAQRDYDGQIEEIEAAIDALDKLRMELELTIAEPHMRTAEYFMGAEK